MTNLFQCDPNGACPGLMTVSIIAALLWGSITPLFYVLIDWLDAQQAVRRREPPRELEQPEEQTVQKRAA